MPIHDPELAGRIVERARSAGMALDESAAEALAAHVQAVLRVNEELHLTAITDPAEYLERHLGEAFEGAAMLDPGLAGRTLDVGSGNGYPGIPIAAVLPGARLLLAEASMRKAAFLRQAVRDIPLPRVEVFEAQVQRASDLQPIDPVRLITMRAMGGWHKILPRLASLLASDGDLLVWCGEEMEAVARRTAWRKLRLEDRKALPERENSWIWRFRAAVPAHDDPGQE